MQELKFIRYLRIGASLVGSSGAEGTRGKLWEVGEKLRLGRKSLQDLGYWLSLTPGEGRELKLAGKDIIMQSDEADVGYWGTLGLEEGQGFPG